LQDFVDTTLDTAQIAAWNKASADPLRLSILQVLHDSSFGVLELCEIFEIAQPAMSHHLKLLAKAGLVTTRREGNSIFYRRALRPSQDPLNEIQLALFRTIDLAEMSSSIQARLHAIYAERAERSQAFFAKNANKFHEQQDLIANFDQYQDALKDILQSLVFSNVGTATEIGPGEGQFLENLSQQFTKVIAIDNSEEMLQKAQRFANQTTLTNIEFIHGEIQALQTREPVQLIVANMVLHHIAAPADFFSAASKQLSKDGILLITDLCAHDQAWAQTSCGDVWLGFQSDDLTAWAEHAGLYDGHKLFLALRNGFQIQVRLFHKKTLLDKALTDRTRQEHQVSTLIN